MEDYMMSHERFYGDASMYLPALTDDLRNTMMDEMDESPIGAYMAYNGAIFVVFSDEENMNKYGTKVIECLSSSTDKLVFIPTYWNEGLVKVHEWEFLLNHDGWRL